MQCAPAFLPATAPKTIGSRAGPVWVFNRVLELLSNGPWYESLLQIDASKRDMSLQAVNHSFYPSCLHC